MAKNDGLGVSRVFMRAYSTRLWSILFLAVAALSMPGRDAGAANRATSTVAKDAHVGGDLTRTRFVADLSETVDFRVFLLADPYRIIVDLPEVKFLMPSGVGGKGKGLVSAFRYGLFAPGKSRIVIDVVEPVLIDKAFVRAAENGQPARLVIDLVRTSPEEFEKQRKKQTALRAIGTGNFQTSTEEIGDGKGRSDSAGRPKKTKPVIVIDPGHGGPDIGAPGDGFYEKDVVLSVSLQLRKALEAAGDYEVHMTRTKDVFIPLGERVAFSRRKGANLFVSIHANSAESHAAEGFETYFLSAAKTEDARRVARMENSAVRYENPSIDPESLGELNFILWDLAQNEYLRESSTLAESVQEEIDRRLALRSRGVKQAGFFVLNGAFMPAILFEMAFISNPKEESLLDDPAFQTRIADALAESLLAHLDRYSRKVYPATAAR